MSEDSGYDRQPKDPPPAQMPQDRGAPHDDDDNDSTNADGGWTTTNDNYDAAGSLSSAFPSVFGELELPLSDTSQLTDGVGTGPYK